MGWILGFGIPLAYVVLGAFFSRAVFRSRHKRGYRDNDIECGDTFFLTIIMFFFWPVLVPFYFSAVWWSEQGRALVEKFYKHNLPETDWEKTVRLEREAREVKREKQTLQKYIDTLEKELEIGPYRKG